MSEDPILFAAYAGVLGGAERVLLDCVTRLDRPLRVACPPGALADELRRAGVEHLPTKDRGLARSVRGTAGFATELTRLRPRTVVAWGAKAVMAAAVVPARRRVAVHHDLFASPALRGAVRATTKRAHAVVAASHAIADELNLPDVTILHPGVDLGRFTPTPLPPGPPRALIAGALVPWKRPDLAVEIARRMPDAQFTFAGEPLPGDPLPDLDPPPNVTFAGRVDIRDALRTHHLLLHCADREPYGLVIVEALAAGRPVVAPDAAGPSELLDRGLYPPGNADAAVERIREALEDPGDPRAHAVDVRDSVARLAAVLG